MSNISLINLAGIPGVNQAAMIQNNINACGAYAVVGAVGAHGAFPMAAVLSYADAGPQAVNNHSATGLPDDFHQLSASVYTITGILNNVIAVPTVPELIAAGNSYNSPAAMAKAVIDLGRQAPKINAQAAGFAILNAIYPGERARCIAVVAPANVDTTAGPHAVPALNETHLLCVNVAGGGLHWVAQGSDGLCYDPGNGNLNHNWAPVNTGDPMGPNYTFTGLWMVVR